MLFKLTVLLGNRVMQIFFLAKLYPSKDLGKVGTVVFH